MREVDQDRRELETEPRITSYNVCYTKLLRIENVLRQIYGNEIIVAPFFVVGGADAKYFAAKPMGINTYTVTPLQLESLADLPRLHGVNERIRNNFV